MSSANPRELYVLGAIAGVAAGAQLMLLVALLSLLLVTTIGMSPPISVNFVTGLLVVIVGIGLYAPLVAVIAGLGEAKVSRAEGLRWGRRFISVGPVALFVFWWRYLRPKSKTA